MENQKGNRNRANNGPISMDLIYWMDWENHTQFRLFSTFLYAENKRLYAIDEGRKRGENAHIPEGWFDFEEHKLEEIMGIDQRNIRIQLRKMESLGLVLVQDGRKRTGKSSKNGRGSVSMNLYRINRELLQRLDEKYTGQRITLENIRAEFALMTKEETPSCYSKNRPFEAPKTVETSNPAPATFGGQECRKECDMEPVVIEYVVPVPAYAEARGKGSSNEDPYYNHIMKNCPEHLKSYLSSADKSEVVKVVRSMLEEGKDMHKQQWMDECLPRLGTSLSNLQVGQLWNMNRA